MVYDMVDGMAYCVIYGMVQTMCLAWYGRWRGSMPYYTMLKHKHEQECRSAGGVGGGGSGGGGAGVHSLMAMVDGNSDGTSDGNNYAPPRLP